MAESLFEFTAAKLEELTDFGQLEARGTVRIGLKEAGLDPRKVTVAQMSVMLAKTMPRELSSRGIESPEEVCRAVITHLKAFAGDATADGESPEDVFRRLGSR